MAAIAATIGFATVVAASRHFGSLSGTAYHARLLYIEHIPPLFWPNEPFSTDAWRQAPAEGRYRLVKSLLAGDHVLGRSREQVGALLGTQVPRDAPQWLAPVRRVGFQNLWWVIVIEFEAGHAVTARRDLAWLDP